MVELEDVGGAATALAGDERQARVTTTGRDDAMTLAPERPEDKAVAWWRELRPYFASGERNPNADRATFARLRRADLMAAMQEPETFELFRKLRLRDCRDLPRVALCAAVLAAVREEPERRGEHPARTLGPPSHDAIEQALMKPLRFRRLIEAETPEEQLLMLRRALQLANQRLNPKELAAACLDWSEERRRRWIFQYYNAGYAAPAGESEPEGEAA